MGIGRHPEFEELHRSRGVEPTQQPTLATQLIQLGWRSTLVMPPKKRPEELLCFFAIFGTKDARRRTTIPKIMPRVARFREP